MKRSEVRSRLTILREDRMWTQARLAEEAGVSPTTVSGIENGRISRPHFGTIKKLARALGVDPQELLSPRGPEGRTHMTPLSLGWAMSSREEELDEEHERLRKLYGEARDSEQRRLIKGRIRDVAAQHGSVETSIAYHPDLEAPSEERTPSE